jgi:putative resolvase
MTHNKAKNENKRKSDDYITCGEAKRLTGLSYPTIRTLGDSQEVKCYKTSIGGHRRFNRGDLEKFLNPVVVIKEIPQVKKDNFFYCRVSSKKQMDDLHRQIEFVQQKSRERGVDTDHVTISDVGSGINFKRKGISTILDSCLRGTIGEIVVAHRDRLSRFGFDLFDILVSKAGGKITVLNCEGNKATAEQELSEDLLSIVHIFSCRQMGKRKYKKEEGIRNDHSTIVIPTSSI